MHLPANTRELPLVLRLQAREGRQRWLQYRIASRPDPDHPGELSVSGTLLDITERMRAEGR